MAFHVPRNAGNHPRLFIGGLLTLVIAAAAVAGVLTTEAPRRVFEADEAAAPPPRPPLVVVEDLPQLKARLDREAEARRFMGAVLVARGDRILFRQVYGKANYERNEPMRLDTRFRLASDSKQFTAAAILTLQDQGKLSVDDALCDWIQPCPPAWAPVRLHHLLTHQSGIPDLMAQANWGMTRTTYRTKDQLIEAAARYGLQFQPGTKIRYDNVGFNLLASVVERASGMPFETYIQQTFFDPLGMADTGSDADGQAQGLAMGYANYPSGLAPQPLANVSIVYGAGALYSTLDDLLIWTRALHHGQLMKAESYADMIASHNPPDTPNERGRPPRAWGYGLYTNRLGERVAPAFSDREIYHTGSWAGFRNIISYQPEADVTVIVLSNNYHMREQVFLISQQAMAEALGHPFPTGMRAAD